MEPIELTDFARKADAQLFGHILPFWCGPALDQEEGGWLPWMSNELKIDRRQPKGLILNCRILWAFSAAFRARPDKLHQEMAKRAFDFVMNRFWDAQFGGAFWRLQSSGMVLEDAKKIYGQAFYIYALTEYHRAFAGIDHSADEALGRAIELFGLIETHSHDAEHGGYFEVCQRNWSAAPDNRLSEKDLDEKKSMNNHLHILEAYTNLYRLWQDSRLRARLVGLITLFDTRIVDGESCHFNHFFDEAWNLRSDTYTYGHDIEGSWLLCEAAGVVCDGNLLNQAETLAVGIAEAVLAEGLDQDGGLSYEGRQGRAIDRRKECWPQAEAVVGFLNAFELSQKEKFFTAARTVWDYIERCLVDRQNGEWFWRINLDGRPEPRLPKVSEWKGPYHGTRACLEVIQRVQRLGLD